MDIVEPLIVIPAVVFDVANVGAVVTPVNVAVGLAPAVRAFSVNASTWALEPLPLFALGGASSNLTYPPTPWAVPAPPCMTTREPVALGPAASPGSRLRYLPAGVAITP